jgi:hypothetical protein
MEHRHGNDAACGGPAVPVQAFDEAYAAAWEAAQPDEGRRVVRVDLEAHEFDWELPGGSTGRSPGRSSRRRWATCSRSTS